MRNIVYEETVFLAIEKYIFDYKSYFYSLYSDTGIFSEQLILDRYEEEAKNRHREIIDCIHNNLSRDIVLGRTTDNTLFLPWRSKILWCTWRDEENIRIITNLIIR